MSTHESAGEAYKQRWAEVDKLMCELKTKLAGWNDALTVAGRCLFRSECGAAADDDQWDYVTPAYRILSAQVAHERTVLSRLAYLAIVLVHLHRHDPEGVLLLQRPPYLQPADVVAPTPMEYAVEVARAVGPERLGDTVKVCERARQEAHAAFERWGQPGNVGAEEARRSLAEAAITAILESERAGTSFFSQVEPYVASTVALTTDEGVQRRAAMADMFRTETPATIPTAAQLTDGM